MNKLKMIFWCPFLLVISCIEIEALEFIEVHTTVGKIKGFADEDVKFLGIPYGFVDPLHPFEPAKPHPRFNATFEAFTDPVQCPQTEKGITSGDINCLNLNIHTPRVLPKHLLPVIIYIFGGQYIVDNGNQQVYNPRFLVKKNIIFVSLNFRLGIFGFLCIKNKFGNKYTNQGLKDQKLAIDWVKNNIEFFGGDPNNIVLMGHSSGATCVDLHLLYNNDNSIVKYIIQSGSAAEPEDLMDETPVDLLKNFKLHLTNASQIYKVVEDTKDWTFLPCFDGKFITKTPKLKSLEHAQILIGGTDLEMLFALVTKNKKFYETYDMRDDLTYMFSKSADKMTSDVEFLRKSYAIDDNLNRTADFISDILISYPMERSVRYYLSKNATVRTYHFSYMGKRNFMQIKGHINSGVTTHGDELGYLFDIDILKKIPYFPEDFNVVELMTTLWTDFAKFGNVASWPPTTKDHRQTLLITDSKPFMVDDNIYRFATLDFLYKVNYNKHKKGVDVGNFV